MANAQTSELDELPMPVLLKKLATSKEDTNKVKSQLASGHLMLLCAVAYPKVTGYFSITHPIATWDRDVHQNKLFQQLHGIFPIGINLLKSDRFGFSFETSPAIRADRNGSKVSSVLFHPGAVSVLTKGLRSMESWFLIPTEGLG